MFCWNIPYYHLEFPVGTSYPIIVVTTSLPNSFMGIVLPLHDCHTFPPHIELKRRSVLYCFLYHAYFLQWFFFDVIKFVDIIFLPHSYLSSIQTQLCFLITFRLRSPASTHGIPLSSPTITLYSSCEFPYPPASVLFSEFLLIFTGTHFLVAF